jgi:hypothetical protein
MMMLLSQGGQEGVKMRIATAIALCVFACGSAAHSEIVGLDLGTDAPPATLGPWEISVLPLDTRPDFTDVLDAPGSPPLSDDVLFSRPMSKRRIGYGWATWSHGYTGVVYYSMGALTVTLDLPPDTAAFVVYVQSATFLRDGWFTATAQDGTSVTTWIRAAEGFAFYGTAGDTITSIEVTGESDFAWGEFYGTQIPEPGTLGLLALGSLGVIREFRRRGWEGST